MYQLIQNRNTSWIQYMY